MTIKLPAKNSSINYVVKLDQLLHCCNFAAVLNDEATVTDATADAALTGGGTLTIPVWYNGTAWTKLGGGSGVAGLPRLYHNHCLKIIKVV
jgi:hypothetical protein